MACFTLTTVAAIGVGVARHVVKHNEKKKDPTRVDPIKLDNVPFSKKLAVLELGLWGGSFILAGEHVFHDEVRFTFPWLTKVAEGQTAEMFEEIFTVGLGMLILIVAAWGVGLLVRRLLLKRKANKLVKE